MSEPGSAPQQDAGDGQGFARAVRVVLVVIVLGLSYFSVRLSWSIGVFERLFVEVLNGRPLPVVTAWVLEGRFILMATSVLAPVLAILTLFLGNLAVSFRLIAILALVVVGQLIFEYAALWLPLSQILAHQ